MMLIITVHVNAPAGQAIGIKERYGDTRVVSVEVIQPTYRQMQIGEVSDRQRGKK